MNQLHVDHSLRRGFGLKSIDPLSKLVALFCAALLAMHWDKPIPLLIMLVLFFGLARYGVGMSWPRLGRRLRFIAVFGMPLFIITSIAAPVGEAFVAWGPLQITIGGTEYAAAITLRMFCLFLSSIIYIESTDPKDFVTVLTTRLKLPYRFVFGVSMALTFLPLLEAESRVARQARQLRFGRRPRGVGERLRMWRGNLAAIFTGAIRRVEQTAGSMESKGFGAYPVRSFLRGVEIGIAGYALMVVSVGVTACLWFI
ncbi:energy-coupling factor transporter transmembrane component T family protein [Paenibacillus lutimineralis]|uniref:Energy-coupling factor transporter transmembrane protein EcfT n=1 Tax=Paenibacillus lutimineralis TaxID=2707005 RepID=A0A3Q9I697_9BACL|nr:energy-coupling factor transporter transmembrane component T [Paenibacillus lutimineralis]AZS13646.1 energy-coupling factor transporter transmembrane protein EcfT [Paenibacillus lutimineralis]